MLNHFYALLTAHRWVRVWNLETGKITRAIEIPNESNMSIITHDPFSPSFHNNYIDIWTSDQFILCESDDNIRAFDARTYQCVHTSEKWPMFLWYEWDLRAPIVYTTDLAGNIYKWDVNTKQKLCTLDHHTKKGTCGFLEGNKLVSSSYPIITLFTLKHRRSSTTFIIHNLIIHHHIHTF